ncbi:S-adenosyl-L-methionine-dependent methyltransferase [Blastocladiella britannica]|nr:S-adenosyl-L-methionine-dependent methyltransferase [Blastocladiella britannica]
MFSPTDPVELLVGDAPTIDEALCGFTFKISPTSFFQVNKPATEVLYGMVRDWALGDGGNTSAKTEKRRVLLDLCCGTGTIGVCMSSGGFDKIVGIDIVADAVADARVNAARNGVSNAEYTAGDVGKVVPRLLESLQIETPHGQELELIAVLDPPRSGVPKSVVKAIRACPAISRVVYVSCDLKQAQGNLVDLMRSPTGQLPGVAFTMHQAAVVDMFPHTRHYETVMEFRRPLAPSSSTEESEKEAEKEDE